MHSAYIDQPVVHFQLEQDRHPPLRSVLVLGKDTKWQKTVELLVEFLPKGSVIHVEQIPKEISSCRCQIRQLDMVDNQRVLRSGHGKRRLSLDSIRLVRVEQLSECDTVALIAEANEPSIHDASVLMILTTFFARTRAHNKELSIVVELLDSRNYELIGAFGNPRAIVSSELISNLIVQLALDPRRGQVYRELLDPSGNEIYVRPAARYIGADETSVTFDSIILRSRKKQETAIGYVTATANKIVLCPHCQQPHSTGGNGQI